MPTIAPGYGRAPTLEPGTGYYKERGLPDPREEDRRTIFPPGAEQPPANLIPNIPFIPYATPIGPHYISGASYDPRTISASTYSPTLTQQALEQLFTLGPSEMEHLQTDPSTRAAQMEALSSMLGSFRSGGFDPTERARLEAMLLAQRQAQTAGAQGAYQQAERRGLGGSAAQLAASLFASQQEAQVASQQGMQLAAQADQRRNQLRSDIGGLAGNIRSQDWIQASDRAKAVDAINRFNIENKQQWSARAADREQQARTANAGFTNEAARFNASQQQAANTFNAGAANQASQFAASTAFQAAQHNAQQTFEAERYNSQSAWQTNARNQDTERYNQEAVYGDAWKRHNDYLDWLRNHGMYSPPGTAAGGAEQPKPPPGPAYTPHPPPPDTTHDWMGGATEGG